MSAQNDDPTPLDLQADVTLEVNYFGTKRITDHLSPLIRPRGR